MKKSQKERVIARLLEYKCVSRNLCLQNYISRLSAIIFSLEREGWDFRTENENGDYIYYTIKCPFRQEELTTHDGLHLIHRYVR